MKSFLCLTVALTCLACVSLSEGGLGVFKSSPATRHALQNLKEFFSSVSEHDHVLAHRQRRQTSAACNRDFQETLSQHFAICNSVLEEIQNADVLTLNATTTFCQQHCPPYMIRLAQKLVVDCGFPDTLDPAEIEFVNQTCAQGPNHVPCLVIWNNTEAQLGTSTSTAAVTYEKCIQENQINSKICNTDCKPAEQWIKDNMGCCYKALVDYYRTVGTTDVGLLTDDNWDICNIKEPQLCSYGRPNSTPTRSPPKNG